MLVDWVSWTVPLLGVPSEVLAVETARWLGLSPDVWETVRGRYGYESALRQGHVEVMFDGMPVMGVLVQVSGQGCRELEQSGRVTDWTAFFDAIRARGGRFSRLDGALDHRGELVSLRRLYRAVQGLEPGVVPVSAYRFKQPVMAAGRMGQQDDLVPQTLYLGQIRSGGSGVRIYDKAAERAAAGVPVDGPWVRIELVLKGDQAEALAQVVRSRGLAQGVTAALRAKLDFRVPSGVDKTVARWRSVGWWDELLGGAAPVVLEGAHGGRRGLTRRVQWLEQECSRVMAIVCESLGPESARAFWDRLLEVGRDRLSEDDWAEIAGYREVGA